MPTVQGRDVPFREAIDYFRQKVDLPTERWTDLWEGMHARAFVVAGATKDGLVAELRAAVDKALADGGTLARFRQEFDGIVERHGWAHTGSRGFRSRVIFETNLRTAYAAGRWQQIERNAKAFPYLRYVGTLDDRIRPVHRRWHGTILPWDHAWWRTHYPPNGWGCRCTVIPLTRSQMERRGWTVSEAPPLNIVPQAVRIDGKLVTVPTPAGIDPGWAYNPGIAAWGTSQQAVLMEAQGGFTPLRPLVTAPLADLVPVPARAALGPRVPRGDVEGLMAAFRRAIAPVAETGGEAATLVDPTGARIRLTMAIPEHIAERPESRWDGREAFFPLMPELVRQPQEIWLGFAASAASGRVSMRRRYVKLVEIGKARTIGLVADAVDGLWSGLTFFRGDASAVEILRRGGVLVWRE
jgi:SPP1 gp7 family putative phage head morphogenesis protein